MGKIKMEMKETINLIELSFFQYAFMKMNLD